ncbi:MAG TPA: hypothetical protein VGZ48_00545 [Candidatus Acidoferrales bacterium]|nr:hypothetical protein [Candidatus Acidoferrales bacterium]
MEQIHNPTAFFSGETPGRFTLYPTENIYNFLLLDQIDGRVWQVQWNWDSPAKRFVLPISPPRAGG